MKFYIAAIVILSGSLFAHAQTFKDIHKIDFGNFTHRIGERTMKFYEGMEGGACPTIDAEGDIWNALTDNIAYGDLDGDGADEVFIPFIANYCGGTAISGETVLVYTLKKGKPVRLPEFEYVDEGCPRNETCDFERDPGVTVSYDAEEKALIVKNYYATEDDATCCPSLSKQTWFKWDGKIFKQLKKSEIEQEKETN